MCRAGLRNERKIGLLELVAKKSFFRPGPTSRPRLFAVGLLLVVLSSLGLTVSAPLASASVTEMELSVHRLVNEHRAAQGLPPLAFSPEISDIARVHSEDMASGRVPGGHAGADGRSEKISNSIPYREFGENVAEINQGGEGGEGAAAVSGWLQSPGHRSNIEGSFDLTGIGIALAASGTYFFTQLFVTPAGKQPGSYGNDPQPLSAHAALTVPKIMATYGDEPPPPAATTRPAPARQARATGPAYSEKAPSRRPGRRRTAGGWAQKLEPRKRRPEKDPRRRPGRRRTAGGWVQKLE